MTGLALFLGGCGMGTPGNTSIDEPPTQQQSLPQQSPSGNISATLYARSPDGLLIPVGVTLPPNTQGVAKSALEAMVDGAAPDLYAQTGFSAVLPKGTKVNGLNISNGVATVDFSKQFNTASNAAEEQQRLTAVVYTLTQFPTVQQVRLQIEGQALTALAKGTAIDTPLSRQTLGINEQITPEAQPGNSMMVTDYFLYQGAQQTQPFLVPVSRVIPAAQDPVAAVVKELIRGPMDPRLQPVIRADAKVLQAKLNGQTATVDLDESALQGLDQQQRNQLAQAIVLSLTELSQVQQVTVSQNGDTAAFSQQSMAQPMMRPHLINPSIPA